MVCSYCIKSVSADVAQQQIFMAALQPSLLRFSVLTASDTRTLHSTKHRDFATQPKTFPMSLFPNELFSNEPTQETIQVEPAACTEAQHPQPQQPYPGQQPQQPYPGQQPQQP